LNKIKYLRFIVVLTLGVAAGAQAQPWPNRPLRIVVGYTSGGAVDFTARLIGQKLTEQLGQPVVTENRPGATTAIATEKVATAAADGHTLLLIPTSTAIQSALRKNLPYDLKRDFAPVSLLATGAFALVVHPSLPVKTLKELIAYAREQPGKLSSGSPGVGSANHLAGALFNLRTKVNILHVPYKGSGEAVIAVAAGQTQMSMPSMASVLPLIESGKVRALAVTSLKRVSSLPNVPTLDESGFAGLEYVAWYGISAPAALPKPIMTRLNNTLAKIVQLPDVKEAFQKQGMESQSSTPEQFAAVIAREIELTAKLLQVAGIKAE
jgi:tripartite-type tricarboxylate transporter receptor subunit TctC